MSFFFNQVVASNSTSNLGVSNSLISKELGKIDLFSSNFFGSHYSAWFNFAGLTFVSSTLVGFTSLGSDFDINFDNNLLLAPLSIFYSTSPLSPTSRFFSLGPPGIQANASCFDHLVYPEPLLSYFKHLYFSCQVCFADNLPNFRRNLPLSNPAMSSSSNSYLHHYISFVPSLQPYYNFINNYFILNGLQSSCLQLDSLASTSLPSFSLSDQVTIPSNLPYLEKQETTIQGGIFFQFSLPKLRLSSFPFALYISRPSSLVPHPSDSHPLVPLDFNRSFYSQNLPSYVGFLGSHFTSIPSSIGDSANPVDDSIDSSIGSSSSSFACFASHNVISIRNISSSNYGLSTCEIPSFHHFLNLRSRTASFFAFLDSFFLLDSPFLDSLPCLNLSSDGLLSSSNHSSSLLSNFNQLHQMSFCLGDAHFLFNNPLGKLLVSSCKALCEEQFLFNHHLFSSNNLLFPLHEEHFSSDEEYFLLAKEHLPLGQEHFLSNNSIFTSNVFSPIKLLTSLPHLAPLSHLFVDYTSLTVSNFSNFSNFNCFLSFSNFARLVTFSSFVSSYIHSPVFSFTHSLFNHMDIYHHLDISKYCLSVNSTFYRLQANSPCKFESYHLSTTFNFIVYNCVLGLQNPTSFFHFIAHNRIFEPLHFVTFFDFAYPFPVFERQNISTFFNLAHPNPVSKLPNAIFLSAFSSAFSCKNLINLLFWPSTLSVFEGLKKYDLLNLPSTFCDLSHKIKSHLLFWPSNSNVFSCLNKVTFQFGSSNSNIFSSQNKCVLLNLASTLKFSFGQKVSYLLNWSSFLSLFSSSNQVTLLFWPSKSNVFSCQKKCHLINLPSFLRLFESLNLINFQFEASKSSIFSCPNHNDLLIWPSHLGNLSCKNKYHLFNLPSHLKFSSSQKESHLFNLASHLSISSHKNKNDLLHCSSFLSAFLDNNSSTFLNSPSLKSLLQKHSSSFSSSTSKQISNNLIKKANNLRSHYRIKMSFEAKVSSQFAISLARNYLLEQFPNALLLAACHQNTNHTHIHVLLFARDVDGKKLHFSNSTYKKLDIGWAKLYSRVFGEHKLHQHIEKKAQSRNWKIDRLNGLERDKPYRISINNRLDHSKNYGDNYKVLNDLSDYYRPLSPLFSDPFHNSVGNNIVKNIDLKLNHTSIFDKNIALEPNHLPLNSNHFAFTVDRNLANNLLSQSNSLTFGVRNLSFEPINFAFDVKTASNFDKSDPLHFSFSNHKDVSSLSKDPVFWNNNLSFSDKQQDLLIKQPDFFGTFFDHNHIFFDNFLDHKLSFWNNNPLDFATCSHSNAILDNKEHLHLLPSINFNLDHNQLFLDHKLPFWNNNPLDFSACSTFNSVLDTKEHLHLQPSINFSDNFVEKNLAFNSSVIEKTSAFNTSFSDKDFLSNALIVDKIVDKNLVSNNVFLDKAPVSHSSFIDIDTVSNRPDHDKVALIDKDLAHHQPSHNLIHHHDLKLNQTLNPFNYHQYQHLIDSFERDYFHMVSERELLEREIGDTHFNEVENDFLDARFAENDFAAKNLDSTDLVGKAPVDNDFDHASIETDHDYDEPIR